MTRSDFNQYGVADTTNVLDDSTKSEGTSSLNMTDVSSGDIAFEILDESETDAPAEGRVDADIYFDTGGGTDGGYGIFRFQDVDNFYAAGLYYKNEGYWFLAKVVGGTISIISETQITSSSWSTLATALSDGSTDITNTWVPWRVDFWVDDSDDLRARPRKRWWYRYRDQ
jgi:hypothetical protein